MLLLQREELSVAELQEVLSLPQSNISAQLSKLKAAGKADTDLALDTKWRKLNGDVRQIEARLRQIAVIEAREAEAIRVKAEKAAAEG